MARKRELASTFDNQSNKRMVASSDQRADNPFEALMVCPPGIDPDPSRDELLPLRDILQDEIENLTEREQWIFDALTSRRLSLRQCGRELGLSFSHIRRIRDNVYTKLRTALIEHEEIRSYLR
mgnify:CR=1 FL=1